jgi:general secretion pathway protein E
MLSIQMNLPYIDLKRHVIQPEALKLIPEFLARKYNIIALDIVDNALIVVMADPEDIQAINDIVAQTGTNVNPAIGIPNDIRMAIDLNYKATDELNEEVKRLLPTIKGGGAVLSQTEDDSAAGTPAARAVSLLLSQAIRQRASDLHFEPQHDRLRVRYRVDGVLHDVATLPLEIHPVLISRVKILADMNIAEKRLPQDGQMSFVQDGRDVDIRVATIETAYGEKMVLRVLDKAKAMLNLSDLGFLPETLENYHKVLAIPYGLILVAGPTGSGKTTTLYASINELDRLEKNIITIEDPVEYLFNDINQTQVNIKAGLTFAAGLRATLRLDPDVILVGELRDADTAKTGAQAAMTGHLVLSSIHANDSAGALLRLVNLDVEPFLVSTSVICVVAQRMIRRICPHCTELIARPVEEQKAYEQTLGEHKEKFQYGAGCNFCADTGYLGRTGIFEILNVSDSIRQMIVEERNSNEIRAKAIEEGMATMMRDGMLKVKEGISTPAEVLSKVYET